jgi:hypothetical protein
MSDEPLAREREPIERVRARLEALVMANAARRCGARSQRTGKPCRAAAMLNGRCKVHGGKSTGPRTPEGLERSRRANWKQRALFAGSQGGTVAPAGGNTCAPQSARRDLRPCTHKSRLFGNRWLSQTRRSARDVQAIFCRRRHQARRPPLAKIRPGRPVPTMGPRDGFGV